MENQEQIEEQPVPSAVNYGVEGVDPEIFAKKEQIFVEKLTQNMPTTHTEMVGMLEEVYEPREITLLLSIMNAGYTQTQQELEQAKQAITMLIAQNNMLSDKLTVKRGKEAIPVRRNSRGYPIGATKEAVRQHFKKKAVKNSIEVGRGDHTAKAEEEETEQ